MSPEQALEQGAPDWVDKWYHKYCKANPNWNTQVKLSPKGMWYVSTVMPV
jgi:hypothetical protein